MRSPRTTVAAPVSRPSPCPRSRTGPLPRRDPGWGIRPSYEDAFGRHQETSEETRRALIAAMGGSPQRQPPAWPRPLPAGSTRCAPAPECPAWGLAVQLYALRSEASWGIGDLVDLARLGAWATDRGAEAVLVNPIDAPLPTTPRDPSPYLPSTRRFRNAIYLRPEAVPGAEHAGGRLEALARGARALNAEPEIDRDRVWELKRAGLRAVWEATRAARPPGLRRFVDEQGRALRRFATYQVLAADHGGDWRDWPDGLQSPDSTAVAQVAGDRSEELDFHMWLQWACDRQLAAAGETVGLLRDLPLGFHPGGFDAWAWQDLLADGVSVGAPPDQLGPSGQDWSLPAFVPHRLAEADFEPWRATLGSAFRHAAGLRIDHVLGLFRLFWIPPDAGPDAGAYVEQPTEPLLEVLARQSRRAGAWVVGEDLGTVAPGVRETMRRRGVLRTLVMWFEEQAPESWPEDAVAMVTTHDLPTVAGVWTGADRAELQTIGVEVPAGWHTGMRQRAVETAGLDEEAAAPEAVVAVHRRLAGAASRMVLAQLEDLCAADHRPNVPGTSTALRANWSRALPLTLEELQTDETARRVIGALADREGLTDG